jgi:hypothetical protein
MRLARVSVLTVCLLSIFAGVASAQVKKGYIDLGFNASLGWSETNFGFGENQQESIRAGIGSLYFVTDHIAIGGSTNLSYTQGENGDGWSYGLGPAFDYHFRPAKDIVPLVGLTGGINRGASDLDSGADVDSEGWFAEVHGGADFFLNDHVALNLLLRAGRSRNEVEQQFLGMSQRSNSRNDNVSIGVGISIFIDTKKGK